MEFANNKDMIIEEMKLKMALRDRIVTLSESIDSNSIFKVKYLIERIIMIDAENKISYKDAKPITLRIDSTGGEVDATMYLVSYIEELKDKGMIINTEACSVCMSGGFKLLIVGSNRVSHRYSNIMVHQPLSFEYGYKTFKDQEIEYKRTKSVWDRLKKYICRYTKIKESQLNKYVKENQDWYMTPEKALELGVIDEIL